MISSLTNMFGGSGNPLGASSSATSSNRLDFTGPHVNLGGPQRNDWLPIAAIVATGLVIVFTLRK